MVTKSKTTGGQKKGRVKVGKLKLNKETVKDLTGGKQKQIKGGILRNLTTDYRCIPILSVVDNTCSPHTCNCPTGGFCKIG